MIDQRIRQLRTISPYTGYDFNDDIQNKVDVTSNHFALKPEMDLPTDSMALSNMRNCLKYMKNPKTFGDKQFTRQTFYKNRNPKLDRYRENLNKSFLEKIGKSSNEERPKSIQEERRASSLGCENRDNSPDFMNRTHGFIRNTYTPLFGNRVEDDQNELFMQREHGLNTRSNYFRQNSLNKETVSFHEAHYLNQSKRPPPKTSMAIRSRNSSAPKFQYTGSEALNKDQGCVISGPLNKMSFKQNYV